MYFSGQLFYKNSKINLVKPQISLSYWNNYIQYSVLKLSNHLPLLFTSISYYTLRGEKKPHLSLTPLEENNHHKIGTDLKLSIM